MFSFSWVFLSIFFQFLSTFPLPKAGTCSNERHTEKATPLQQFHKVKELKFHPFSHKEQGKEHISFFLIKSNQMAKLIEFQSSFKYFDTCSKWVIGHFHNHLDKIWLWCMSLCYKINHDNWTSISREAKWSWRIQSTITLSGMTTPRPHGTNDKFWKNVISKETHFVWLAIMSQSQQGTVMFCINSMRLLTPANGSNYISRGWKSILQNLDHI